MTRFPLLCPSFPLVPALALAVACGGTVVDPATDAGEPETGGSSPTYEADEMAGLLDRYVILRRDWDANRCTRILMLGHLTLGFPTLDLGIETPEGWAVEQAEITDDVTDCDFVGGDTPPPPHGQAETADAGSGIIEATYESINSPIPRSIAIHAKLSFTPGGAFPPASVALEATGLELGSGH